MSEIIQFNLWKDDGTSISPLNDREVIPEATDGAALGSATVMWSDLFLADGGVINFNNGNQTITHSAGNLKTNGSLAISGALSGVTTIGMSDDLTMSKDSATITHSGTTSLTISSTSGTVIVEGITFTGDAITGASSVTSTTFTDGTFSVTAGAISGVTTLGMSGVLTTGGAVDITIANEGDDIGLTVTQNDVTNNPVATSITNNGTGVSLNIDSLNEGEIFKGSWTGKTTNGKYGFWLENKNTDAFTGNGALIWGRCVNATDTGRLLDLRHAGTNITETVASISKQGSGTGRVLDIINAGTGNTLFLDHNNSGIMINADQDVATHTGNLDWDSVSVVRTNTASSTSTNTGSVLYLENQITLSDTATDTTNVLELVQDADSTGYALKVTSGTVLLGGGQFVNTTAVSAATYDLLVSDYILNCDYTSTAAITSLTLPTAQCVDGRVIVIKDTGGLAGTNNITVDTEGAETIDGGATYILNTNYESITLYSDGSNWFII